MVTGTYSSVFDTQSVEQNSNKPHLMKDYTQQHCSSTDVQPTLETYQSSEHQKPAKRYSAATNAVTPSKFSANTYHSYHTKMTYECKVVTKLLYSIIVLRM